MQTGARAETLSSKRNHTHAVGLNGSLQLEAGVGNRREPWVQFSEAQATQRDMNTDSPSKKHSIPILEVGVANGPYLWERLPWRPVVARSWCQSMGAEVESEILMQILLFQLYASEPCSAAGPNLEAQM